MEGVIEDLAVRRGDTVTVNVIETATHIEGVTAR